MHIRKFEFRDPLDVLSGLHGVEQKLVALLHDASGEGFSIICIGDHVDFDLKDDFLGAFSLSDLELQQVSHLPFIGGVVGFFSYDFGMQFEGLESSCIDDVNYPYQYFLSTETTIVFDHSKREMWMLGDEVEIRDLSGIGSESEFDSGGGAPVEVTSNLDKEMYCEKLESLKEYLVKGETYQVNFSQRFSFESQSTPLEVFKRVTKINPTKYQAYLKGADDSGDFFVVSNSPEQLFKVRQYLNGGRLVSTRPIKGTIGLSGSDAPEDEISLKSQALLASEKDRAELEMIVDMSRNDLGRICEFGSVQVVEHRKVEKYSHLLHTVSTVQGVLKKKVDWYDIMRALFPGASITGAPKVRTMQVIDELEEFSRGVYCGSFGYFDIRGNAEFNIMIRTLFARPSQNGYDYKMHSGGGVTICSNPEGEYDETFDKINAFLQALSS